MVQPGSFNNKGKRLVFVGHFFPFGIFRSKTKVSSTVEAQLGQHRSNCVFLLNLATFGSRLNNKVSPKVFHRHRFRTSPPGCLNESLCPHLRPKRRLRGFKVFPTLATGLFVPSLTQPIRQGGTPLLSPFQGGHYPFKQGSQPEIYQRRRSPRYPGQTGDARRN